MPWRRVIDSSHTAIACSFFKMIWHDIRDPNDPALDELAVKYGLHPLHIEDCRHRNQTAKVESQNDYLFIVLKPVTLEENFELTIGDLDFFISKDFLITVQETDCPPVAQALDRAHVREATLRPDQLFHRIADQLVDSYNPMLDSDRIDDMEDAAIQLPEPKVLEQIFELRRALIEFRRVMTNSREVMGHLLFREQYGVIGKDVMPFIRDIYDHIVRGLDTVEILRDLLTGTTELYLSSVANRTNQVMKALTVFGAIATPALVITGMYGINLKYLPFAEHSHSWGIVMTIIAVVCAVLLFVLRRLRWL